VIKLRRMKWAGHVARVVERRGFYSGVVGKREGKKDHLEDPDLDGRIILRCVFKKWDWGHGLY